MKLLKTLLVLILPLCIFAQGHLVFSELVLQPSAGEYVIIKNSTSSAVDLSDYYITDATDIANGKYYYNLPGNSDYWSGSGSDFIARFPVMNIDAGASLILALGRDTDYFSEYGTNADLYLKGTGADTMLQAVNGALTIGGSPNAKLDNIAETLILFYWDGSASTVQDVDYLLWGSNAYAIDKSGIGSYLNDTPIADQSFMPVHADGEKLIRISDTEGTESHDGVGNGINGHDETSENLAATWSVVDLASSKPTLSNVVFSPAVPTDLDTLRIDATVVDESGGLTVECVYTFGGVKTITEMASLNVGADDFGCAILPLGDIGSFTYYIRAENTLGLKDSTIVYNKNITQYVETQTIAYLRDNYDDLQETTVTVTGIVTVQMGLINTYASYIQDASGRGIYIFGSAMGGFVRGTQVEVTGTLSEYNGSLQIKDISATSLGASVLPDIAEYTCQQLNNNFMTLEGTMVKVHGRITDRVDALGGGSNVTLDDGTASLVLRVWDSTNLWSDATADSLMQVGNLIEVQAIVGFYSNAAQLLPAYAADITVWVDGDPGTGLVTLTVAPYPFVPQLGEVINYSYEYPDEARVIIRIYDLSGRYVTTLTDEYHGMSWTLDRQWNGRDELNQFLSPGTYIMHMEVIERSTGIVHRKVQPVVIAVKK